MSNAIHLEVSGRMTACGHYEPAVSTSLDRSAVTCKRCLASLAKRDRSFQRKSARAFDAHRESYMANCRYRMTPSAACRALDAARAIAREEGRAL